MDLIGEERGRLARAASWLQASPAETVGLAALLVAALVATAVLVWSALGRPTLAATSPAGEAASTGAADAVAEVGDVGDAVDAGDGHGGHGDHPATGDGAPPDEGADTERGGTPAAAEEVTVHVAGAVAEPGVVVLPAGARVTDAVEASGGLLPDADLARVNLARPLEDGEQLLILREGEEAPAVPPAGTTATGPGAGVDGQAGPVDLNTASLEQLQGLPGIGPTLAARIVEHREQHGPFQAPGDLRDVSGIGEKRFQDLADRITVG